MSLDKGHKNFFCPSSRDIFSAKGTDEGRILAKRDGRGTESRALALALIEIAEKGNLIVMPKSTYIQDGLTHLSDTQIYKQLPGDPTPKLVKEITKVIKQIHQLGHIDENTTLPHTHY